MSKITQQIRGGAAITNPDLTLVAANPGIKARRVWAGAGPGLGAEPSISGCTQGVLSPKESGQEEGERYEVL